MEFAFNAENVVPAFDVPPGSFVPRSIAEAAAAAAVFKPVSINLSPSMSESEVALSEHTLRSAMPPPGLQGRDEFEVLADEAASALRTLQTTTRPSPIASVPTSNIRHGASPVNRIAESADPFDRDAFDAHLASVENGLATFPGVHVHPGDAILASLRAAAKAGGGARVRARGGTSLVLGDTEYVLMGLAGSGANAKVYEAEFADVVSGSDENDEGFGGLAIKVQTSRLARWEWMVCKRLAGRIDPSHAEGVVQPSALHLVGGGDAVRGSDAAVGVLIMPFGDHGTLQDVLNSYLRVGKQMDELLVMYYAIELLRVVESLHLAGVIHADIKPDNLLVRNGGDDWCDWTAVRPGSWKQKGLSLIDFGLAVDLGMYDWRTVFVGDCGTEGFRCSEMVEGKPWTWQADTHQIAATVHALLFGKYMQVHQVLTDDDGFKYRPRESLKRWWKTEMWEIFFEVLLNFPTLDFKSPPPLGDLRRMFEEHIMEERLGAELRIGLMKQTVNMFQQLREGKT
jgi:checkpoint serine/threonine-protein kinase